MVLVECDVRPGTHTPCVSVVMPCFNKERTIKQAVAAVLELLWVSEVPVVDDASTNTTLDNALSVP